MNKICFGCGIKLQNKDKSLLGYTPKEDALYCMRCFRMINYGEHDQTKIPKSTKEIINKINKDNKFVIFLVDFLNINEMVVNIFNSIKKDKVLIINKCELIPSHVNKNKLINYLKEYYKIDSLIKLKGLKNNREARSIKTFLENNNIKESYILGISNCGKSTLINDLITLYKSNIVPLTVNRKCNTTLDFIRVKLSDKLTIIDSPGFIVDKYINQDVSNQKIISYTYNMKENDILSLYDKYYFKFLSSTPITFYLPGINKKDLKKVYKDQNSLINTLEIEANTDLYIYGIGFMVVKNKTFIKTSISLDNIEIRPSILGGEHE